MIRALLTPNSETISFTIPEYYIGKELEVIAFSKNEGFESKEFSKKQVTFNALSIDTKIFKFSRDEANER